nr:alpha-glucuronidase family glycosyl hydrolase [uncultured Sphingomonas sp.]
MNRFALALLACLLSFFALPDIARAEDGYRLWLRYDPVRPAKRDSYRQFACQIVASPRSAVERSAAQELQRGLGGLLAGPVAMTEQVTCDGAIVLRREPSAGMGDEGFALRSSRLGGRRVTVIAAAGERGLLYGAFALLRRVQTGQSLEALDVIERPHVTLRMLNHWDNLDRHVERGYAGQSLWDWHKLPLWQDPRVVDYARANASVGINAAVLNNVNSSSEILTPGWIAKVAALAGQMRPWGIRVFVSARFSAPKEIGGLPTADPLDPAVRRWWKAKADELYTAIPDFGGFLVKANSEGQPGPQDYGRSHADGANMLAEALGPHRGTVLWRAFVYAPSADDRVKQGYAEFQPLDGKFARNVVVQVKNGPLDFQPREPFHPLFGAMPRTRVALEVQLTKEYLGFATHLAYLGPMWSEVLQARTFRPQPGSRVRDSITVMAGVANAGTDRNWTGSHFDQANWYAFGRMAWHPDAEPDAIADEWTRMTWGDAPQTVATIRAMMMGSREAVVDYMTPLGLAHLMGSDHHYGPAPWVADLGRPDWNPIYYHRADQGGIGVDRGSSGTGAISQYAPQLQRQWSNPATTPERYLLWFHRVRWDRRMPSGRSLWSELLHRYDRGVSHVTAMRQSWASLAGDIDPERHREVAAFLAIQQQEAVWWRDASIAYWQHVSGRPLPSGVRPPTHPLSHYQALRFPFAPGMAR